MKPWRLSWLLLVPVIPWVQARIDGHAGEWRAQHEVLYLWSGAHVRRMCLDFEGIMADVYWLRTVQYFGSQRAYASDKRYDLLPPLVEITTTLDPRMEIAYRYGATFMAEPWPIGAGKVEEGVALLEKGVAMNPRSWRLRQDLALFHFFFRRDAQKASAILMEASRQPGAPAYFAPLAAAVLARGGERAASRHLWRNIHQQTEPGPMKDNAALHLAVLDGLDAVDAINRASEAFASRTGRHARSLEEIRAAGLLRGGLADPTGVPFDYDPASGRASISRSSILWRARS